MKGSVYKTFSSEKEEAEHICEVCDPLLLCAIFIGVDHMRRTGVVNTLNSF